MSWGIAGARESTALTCPRRLCLRPSPTPRERACLPGHEPEAAKGSSPPLLCYRSLS